MTACRRRNDRRFPPLFTDWWWTASSRPPRRAMLHAVGFSDADFAKPQVGIASTWSNLTPCNMHIDELARLAAAGRRSRGRQGGDLQHHHRLRRHLDGHAGHALFAGVARGDRRFDRDGGRRAGLRRRGGHRRLRQEHAGLPDGAGAPRPARRSSSTAARSGPAPEQTRHRLGVRGGRRLCAGARCRSSELKFVERTRDSRPRLLRRHVHGQHHGLGDRGAGHEPAEQLGARRRLEPKARGLPRAPARRSWT